MRFAALVLVSMAFGTPAAAEVTNVTIAARATVAGGQAFGSVGAYEKLVGTIEFALDPAHARNARVVDLGRARKAPDGRVHFTADLYVLRPADASRGNGVLLFEVANRGNKGLLARFNVGAAASADPMAAADFGDGFLMRQGYTLVWVGWEFDVPPQALGIEAPLAEVGVTPISVDFIPDEAGPTASLAAAAPMYAAARVDDPADTLTVRTRYWDPPTTIPRASWRFVSDATSAPALTLDTGFEPGRIYTVRYGATGARVAGVGMAALRDAASAFRYRDDVPVRGRAAYIIGISQSGRFLRQFLNDGFNADEQGRRAFDAVWAHIAGAAQGSFNERFAMPRSLHPFTATRLPFTDEPQQPGGAGLLSGYAPELRPKVFYTNTSVEYWGQGRAAAMTHVSADGANDITLPADVRLYLLAGTQHGEGAFPPRVTAGRHRDNPTPQRAVMRALLTGLHGWVSRNEPPPASRYPRLSDGTLTRIEQLRFPALPDAGDPRTVTGPALVTSGTPRPLPFLVPQVDADGNEVGGIRVPEQLVPLATTTGWNFRNPSRGNPADLYALLGSYLPLPRTKAEREARRDPRPSIEERYRDRDDYLRRVRGAAQDLVKERFLLEDDVPGVLERAAAHWDLAVRATAATN
jgi:hypothetical protein